MDSFMKSLEKWRDDLLKYNNDENENTDECLHFIQTYYPEFDEVKTISSQIGTCSKGH